MGRISFAVDDPSPSWGGWGVDSSHPFVNQGLELLSYLPLQIHTEMCLLSTDVSRRGMVRGDQKNNNVISVVIL